VKVQNTLFWKEKLFSLKVTGKRPLWITNIATWTDYKDYSKTKIDVYYINSAVPTSQGKQFSSIRKKHLCFFTGRN
jgi:hypothetical protein